LPLDAAGAGGVGAAVPERQPLPVHAAWLGCSWQADAQQTAAVLARRPGAWLVVDHYALDQRWERALRPACERLMVIDDLADRAHDCDLLLDQNLGRVSHDYAALLAPACHVLAGAQYAMLRPGFAALRDASLHRRGTGQVKQLLITMGGVDQPNATGRALDALKLCALDDDTRITVVMGASAPWLAEVRELARQMPWPIEVLVNISDMAERMAASDLAIGAAGGAAWERCSLGLPTLMAVLAENQRPGALALQRAGAATLIGGVDAIAVRLPTALGALLQGRAVAEMSEAAAAVTDGRGVDRVVREMESI
jgi:UDP-2,4-diacetamido-2,4,6-trideoxy-beta-L-altropyranose hydrolase